MNDFVVPWPRPKSVYDNDGPGPRVQSVAFPIIDIVFEVARTEVSAGDTGRTRYRVECKKCRQLLHEATTGPKSYIESHIRDAHPERASCLPLKHAARDQVKEYLDQLYATGMEPNDPRLLPYPDADTGAAGTAHFAGCFRKRGHHNCAVKIIDAQDEKLERQREKLELLKMALIDVRIVAEKALRGEK